MTVALQTLIDRSVRNIGNVHESVKARVLEIIQKAYEEDIYVQFSSGLRSFKEQADIFGQGRPWYKWNGEKCGSDGNVVSNAMPGQSVHNYGLAVDYFLVSKDGQDAIWTVNRKWKRVAEIAKGMGFTWGGDWTSFKDYPHLELTGGLTWRDLKEGKRPTHLLNEARPSDGLLENGDSGEEVEKLQKDLLTLGIDLPVYGADGDYGDETEDAVFRFQKQQGLKEDGIAGEQTLKAIKEALCVKETGFKDVKEDHSLAREIRKAKKLGVTAGFPDGTFRPDEPVTRAQAVAFAVRASEEQSK